MLKQTKTTHRPVVDEKSVWGFEDVSGNYDRPRQIMLNRFEVFLHSRAAQDRGVKITASSKPRMLRFAIWPLNSRLRYEISTMARGDHKRTAISTLLCRDNIAQTIARIHRVEFRRCRLPQGSCLARHGG